MQVEKFKLGWGQERKKVEVQTTVNKTKDIKSDLGTFYFKSKLYNMCLKINNGACMDG